MKAWKELTHYAGLDWAKDHHAVIIVNVQGGIVADFEFAHSLEGWKSLVEKTSAWPHLAIAIETSQERPSISCCNEATRSIRSIRCPR